MVIIHDEISEDRARKVDFTGPYIDNAADIIQLKKEGKRGTGSRLVQVHLTRRVKICINVCANNLHERGLNGDIMTM